MVAYLETFFRRNAVGDRILPARVRGRRTPRTLAWPCLSLLGLVLRSTSWPHYRCSLRARLAPWRTAVGNGRSRNVTPSRLPGHAYRVLPCRRIQGHRGQARSADRLPDTQFAAWSAD